MPSAPKMLQFKGAAAKTGVSPEGNILLFLIWVSGLAALATELLRPVPRAVVGRGRSRTSAHCKGATRQPHV